MRKFGCEDCKYYQIYHGDYWTPDECECIGVDKFDELDLSPEEVDTIFTRVWVNGEQWNNASDQICPVFEQYVDPECY